MRDEYHRDTRLKVILFSFVIDNNSNNNDNINRINGTSYNVLFDSFFQGVRLWQYSSVVYTTKKQNIVFKQ